MAFNRELCFSVWGATVTHEMVNNVKEMQKQGGSGSSNGSDGQVVPSEAQVLEGARKLQWFLLGSSYLSVFQLGMRQTTHTVMLKVKDRSNNPNANPMAPTYLAQNTTAPGWLSLSPEINGMVEVTLKLKLGSKSKLKNVFLAAFASDGSDGGPMKYIGHTEILPEKILGGGGRSVTFRKRVLFTLPACAVFKFYSLSNKKIGKERKAHFDANMSLNEDESATLEDEVCDRDGCSYLIV